MNTKLICAIATLTLLADVALAEPLNKSHDSNTSASQFVLPDQNANTVKKPMLLNEKQMDGVTAGWDFHEGPIDTLTPSGPTLAGAVAGLTATVTTAVVTAVVAGKGAS